MGGGGRGGGGRGVIQFVKRSLDVENLRNKREIPPKNGFRPPNNGYAEPLRPPQGFGPPNGIIHN